MKKIFLTLSIPAILGLVGCNSESSPEETTKTTIETTEEVEAPSGITMESNGITLNEVVGSPTFPGSKLSILSPELNSDQGLDSVVFNFKVTGGEYKLGSQSVDAKTKKCSNSAKGQHVHLIIDNNPYAASYTENFTKKNLEAGNHVALAFISRSYHESLKHDGAYALTQFKVGEAEMDLIDLEAPHLFYSRPKGSYEGDNTENVMLDFYLVNTEIGTNGNYVQVTINDEAMFKITKWAPYFIKGLKAGTNKIDIQLMDKDNHFIEGPFNHETREITITKG